MRLTDEFVQTAADNVERLLKAKDEARRSAVRRDDGSYVFTLGGSGSHAETKMTIEVSAENINSVFEKNLHTTLSDAADEKAKKMAILAQMPGADGEVAVVSISFFISNIMEINSIPSEVHSLKM